MLWGPIQLACTETGAPPSAGQLIGTDGCTLCSQVLIWANASLGTGGLQGSLGHPPIFPAHQRNSRLGSLACVKVPSATPGALKSKESDLILVALNRWPAEVLRLGFCEPVNAKLTPEGRRELFTGLFGQDTVQVPMEQETEFKLFGPPT